MRLLSSRAKAQFYILPLSMFFYLPAHKVNAAGYGVYENSASFLATAFAGRASNPQDASIIANNPAGASFVDGTMLSAGAAVILEGGEFKGCYEPQQNDRQRCGKTKDFQKTTPIPFGHIVIPYNEQLSFGLSGYAPFGIELDYKKDWPGNVFGIKTSVQVMNLQGTVSYKVQDDFSVGFGLIGSYVKGELTQYMLSSYLPAKVEGDATELSWNVGALWNITDQTSLGLAYHHKLAFTLKGSIKLDLGNVWQKKEDAKLKITMPERFEISLTHKLNAQWTLMAEATWTRWGQFETFHVEGDDILSSYVPMYWKDVWAIGIGGSYQLNEQWLLRAGYMFDESPVTAKTRTVRSPDSDRNWFTFGVNWKPEPALSVDVSVAYVALKKSKISEEKYSSDGMVEGWYGVLNGKYSNSSMVLAAQVNYQF